MPKPYFLYTYRAASGALAGRPEGAPFAVIAHRGASADYPENTLVSFEAAIAEGADMVELDVQLTSDGEVVVFHDEKISRTTNGRGRVGEHTFLQLRRLDAGSWFNKKFRGEKIPLLAEVLDLCKDRFAVNVEIKTEAVTDAASDGIEEKTLTIVDRAGMREHVVFSSFDPRAVLHVKQIDAARAVAVLFEKKYYGTAAPSRVVEQLGADAFNCSWRELDAAWLLDLKQAGIPVHVYTVNTPGRMKRLIKMGVEGIFTNRPAVLKKVLEDSWSKMKP